jgi:hypothetical protein
MKPPIVTSAGIFKKIGLLALPKFYQSQTIPDKDY